MAFQIHHRICADYQREPAVISSVAQQTYHDGITIMNLVNASNLYTEDAAVTKINSFQKKNVRQLARTQIQIIKNCSAEFANKNNLINVQTGPKIRKKGILKEKLKKTKSEM